MRFPGGGNFGFALGLKGTSNGEVLGQSGALFDGGDVQNSIQVQTLAAEHFVLLSYRSETLHLEVADQNIAQGILVLPLMHANVHFFLV
jgi:hypothetical protein